MGPKRSIHHPPFGKAQSLLPSLTSAFPPEPFAEYRLIGDPGPRRLLLQTSTCLRTRMRPEPNTCSELGLRVLLRLDAGKGGYLRSDLRHGLSRPFDNLLVRSPPVAPDQFNVYSQSARKQRPSHVGDKERRPVNPYNLGHLLWRMEKITSETLDSRNLPSSSNVSRSV